MVIKMTDEEERRRILREARATLDRRPEPYVYKARPRAYLDDAPEFVPAPARSPRLDTTEQRQAPTATEADPWAGWERWLSIRIESALAEERERTAEIMAEVIAAAREASQRELHAQIGELKVETAKLEHAMRHLSELITLEKNRTIDLPALPARDRFN
jgi:hypothetical protein